MNNIEDLYELSPMQQGMLFHTLYAPESEVYFEQLLCTLQGKLNFPGFVQAWQQVVARHPVLRSSFYWEEMVYLNSPFQHHFFQVQAGEGLLIVGPSGRGKSSLLRAIAGLWNAGTGRLVRPPLEDVLFLPQRPYIILGTLREQLLYPHTNRQMSDRELEEVLRQVNLQNLLTRVDGFDTEVPWENILSLGEQQRLAFARLLVTHPSFTILDEATSALDLNNEGNLYQQLQQTETTYISVGHRESMFNYHQWVLELSQDSSWQLVSVQDYRLQKAKEIVTNPPEKAQITIDILPNNESQTQPAIGTIEGLSHNEMQTLTDYSLTTIRSKASLGKSITTKDGVTYHYDLDPKVLKWVKV